MPGRTPDIISYPIVPLEDIAELEAMLEEGADPDRIPDIFPTTVSLEDVPGLEDKIDDDADPVAAVLSSDHAGVDAALSILSPRERQILARKADLDELDESHKNAEIAADFGLAVNSVASMLSRARNRLRAVPNIVGIINGEIAYRPDDNDNPLQTS